VDRHPGEYVARLRRYRDEIGHLMWAAPQDWMCEPIIINGGVVNGQRFAGTHLSVTEHQRRTVANYARLRDLAPDLPIIPVVQGSTPDEYRRCQDLYWSMLRLDLSTAPRVGVGSICRRQGTPRGWVHHRRPTRGRVAPAAPVRLQNPRPGRAPRSAQPIDSRADYAEWRSLLTEAKVRAAPAHSGNHAARAEGPTRAVMDVMGWAQASMASRYQHVPVEVLKGIAGQVGSFLWNDRNCEGTQAD